MNIDFCPDAHPNILGLFDLSIAPSLLFYSYLPIFALSVSFGVFLLIKDKYSLLSKYFFVICILFALYILLSLIQWTAVHIEIVFFSWQVYLIPEIGIFLFAIPLAYVFLYGKDPTPPLKSFIVLTLILVACVLPTNLNIAYFDVENCEGISGSAWPIVYIFELFCLLVIIFITIVRLHSEADQKGSVKTVIFSTGLVFFLAIFWASNYFGELNQVYEINLVGPVGMLLFLCMLSYMIVRFKIFNVKLFTSEILVLALWFLVAALLFIQNVNFIHIVVLFTVGLVSILGANLIRSVKKEIDQREKIEKLAVELEQANAQLKELDTQKDELLGMVSHQLATPVSSIKWYLEMLADGDLGDLNKEQNEHVKSMRGIGDNMSDLVSMILDVSRIQLGKMRIEKQDLDLNEFFRDILSTIEPKALEKKVIFSKMLPEHLPVAKLDRRYTNMTIENLLSNAVKYTPEGGKVSCEVTIADGRLRVKVVDTGMGIPKAEQAKIFGRMFRASNARNAIDGNGFGLFVAKGAVEAQGGKIWFDSVEGKGTTFHVELPLA